MLLLVLPQLVLAACIAAGMICASPCCRGLAPSCPPPSLPSASLPDCLPPPAASPRNACMQGAVLRDSGGQSVSGAAAGAGASHRRTPADGEAAKLGQEGRLGRQPATGQAAPMSGALLVGPGCPQPACAHSILGGHAGLLQLAGWFLTSLLCAPALPRPWPPCLLQVSDLQRFVAQLVLVQQKGANSAAAAPGSAAIGGATAGSNVQHAASFAAALGVPP